MGGMAGAAVEIRWVRRGNSGDFAAWFYAGSANNDEKENSPTWKRGSMPPSSSEWKKPSSWCKPGARNLKIQPTMNAPRLVSAQAAMDAAQEALDTLYARWAKLEKERLSISPASQRALLVKW